MVPGKMEVKVVYREIQLSMAPGKIQMYPTDVPGSGEILLIMVLGEIKVNKVLEFNPSKHCS